MQRKIGRYISLSQSITSVVRAKRGYIQSTWISNLNRFGDNSARAVPLVGSNEVFLTGMALFELELDHWNKSGRTRSCQIIFLGHRCGRKRMCDKRMWFYTKTSSGGRVRAELESSVGVKPCFMSTGPSTSEIAVNPAFLTERAGHQVSLLALSICSDYR